MKRVDSRVKVPVRIETLWAVGEWYVDSVAQRPSLADSLRPDAHRFMTGLLLRKSSPLKLDRDFAERFVEAWSEVFIKWNRAGLLVSIADPADRAPVEGIDALAELVADIGSAIRATEGRPERVDAVEAVGMVEAKKVGRQRGQAEQAVELAAEEAGVSVKTMERARAKGKRIISNVRKAIGDAEPLFVLTEDGTAGVALLHKK
jgi:hypothetical protein